MDQDKHRTWAEISLNTIEHNFHVIQEHVGSTPIMAVVKANAYGHGSVPVAHRLVKAGATRFAVATVLEAVELRQSGISFPILVLGYVNEKDAHLLAEYDIAAAVYNHAVAEGFSKHVQLRGGKIRIHIALDTGMTRLGFDAKQARQTADAIEAVISLPGIELEGMFTHFAVADVSGGQEFTEQQLGEFQAVDRELAQRGIHIPIKHCANSGGVLQYKNGYFDMVRAGIILYGYHPDAEMSPMLDLRPAMTLKARVIQIREVIPGQTISYGRTYLVEKHMHEAVISIGYADGYLRTASNKVQVVVNNQKVPVLGRICMDMCMVEVPLNAEISEGDEVTLFGNTMITADDVAAAAGTISYEVLCAVSARVPRVYID